MSFKDNNLIENLDLIRISSADTIRHACEAYRDIVQEKFNMRIAATHNIALNTAIVDEDGEIMATEVFGWDDTTDWWKTNNLALESPLTMACRYESDPFWINKDGVRSLYPNSFLDDIDLSKFGERAKTKCAIVVPIHMPFSQIGAVSYNPIDDKITDLSDVYADYATELGIYARAFIRSYMNVTPPSRLLPSGSKLSKREVECLLWAAMGKTDIEISMIIKRSRATVRFHIHNASIKLDAVNRSQAVFKATQLGYISLNS
ncbi:MAG: helix-turn-helix transcriptional regulator [Parvibaculales bacterium]